MLRALVALLFLGVGSVRAADYFPLAKGHAWDYVGTANDAKIALAIAITTVKTEKGTTRATRKLTLTMGDKLQDSEEEVTVDGEQVSGGLLLGLKSEPKLTMLKLPLSPRDVWTQKVTVGANEFLVRSNVKEPSEVKVPAGTFTAVAVQTGMLFEGEAVGITTWYADGTGMVKQVVVVGANTLVLDLKKFTCGK